MLFDIVWARELIFCLPMFFFLAQFFSFLKKLNLLMVFITCLDLLNNLKPIYLNIFQFGIL